MADLLYDISLPVTFGLTDNPAFWADMAKKAADIDAENSGEPQESYSQAQALTVVFHYDGVDSILAIAAKHKVIVGWSADPTWEKLGAIGATIPVPPPIKLCVLTGCEDPYYATAGDLDLCQHHFDQIKDVT